MMQSRAVAKYISPVLLMLVLALSACTISLVPAYDSALAEGLADANRQALLLFSQVEDEASKGTVAAKAKYPARADDYAKVISAFEELLSRAQTRPLPPLSTRLAKTKFFRSVCQDDDATKCLNASPASIGKALDTLRELRTQHRENGIDATTLKLFKGQYLTAIQQALTVESALKR